MRRGPWGIAAIGLLICCRRHGLPSLTFVRVLLGFGGWGPEQKNLGLAGISWDGGSRREQGTGNRNGGSRGTGGLAQRIENWRVERRGASRRDVKEQCAVWARPAWRRDLAKLSRRYWCRPLLFLTYQSCSLFHFGVVLFVSWGRGAGWGCRLRQECRIIGGSDGSLTGKVE